MEDLVRVCLSQGQFIFLEGERSNCGLMNMVLGLFMKKNLFLNLIIYCFYGNGNKNNIM